MGVMKTAERLTRRSYKRKIITLGISMFSALAMFATGFASWIISSDATAQGNGSINMDVVADQSITIENYQISVDKIAFNPVEGDIATPDTTLNPNHTLENGYGGRVYYSRDDGAQTDSFESLVVKFTGRITGYDNIGDLYIKLEVPAGVIAAANASPTRDGATKKYITLPKCVVDDALGIKIMANGAELTSEKGAVGADHYWKFTPVSDGTYDFEYTFKFSWGDFFGGTNPGLYYDTTMKTLPGYKVEEELNAFRALLLNGEDDIGNFTFTITAKAGATQD